ncbi:aldolase/citrate lyase family protein [Robertmurraya sp. 2P01SA]|uniref:HpcH/HpaI aldolase family protein n=1 Tax=Robertmurraya sp. 2P01SA TaxID=3132300 RepID=UPI0039A6E35C
MVRVLKQGEMQFVIVDCEHGYFDYSQIAQIVSVGNGFGLPVIIRVPGVDKEFISKVLDMGANGILVPMVNHAEEAKAIVEYAKYPPLGKRGVSVTRAHSNYNPGNLKDYLEQTNRNTLVLVQIETQLAVRNSKEIAAVEGINGLIIGPNDLSMDLDTPGEIQTPSMDKAIETVVQAAEQSNKLSGTISTNMKFLQKCKEKGMTFFSCNSEVGMILKSSKQTVQQFYIDSLKIE